MSVEQTCATMRMYSTGRKRSSSRLQMSALASSLTLWMRGETVLSATCISIPLHHKRGKGKRVIRLHAEVHRVDSQVC